MTNDHAVPTGALAQTNSIAEFDSIAEMLSRAPTAIVTPTGQITFGRTAQTMAKLAEKIAEVI